MAVAVDVEQGKTIMLRGSIHEQVFQSCLITRFCFTPTINSLSARHDYADQVTPVTSGCIQKQFP